MYRKNAQCSCLGCASYFKVSSVGYSSQETMSVSLFWIFSALGHMLAKLLSLAQQNMMFNKLSYQLLNANIEHNQTLTVRL